MLQRWVITVEGVVQGVGFRPFVHRLAVANALAGFVRNDARGVTIDIEGEARGLDTFCRTLTGQPPALASLAEIRVQHAAPGNARGFHIAHSDIAGAGQRSVIPPDAATCDACRAELFDRGNRRFAHPFITCTDCGPRFTIVRGTPYDRERTTMASFAPCDRCLAEYDDPENRRFHAETISCPDCGPRLFAYGGDDAGVLSVDAEALAAAVVILQGGGIVALKALGGFHLACDASSTAPVALLRARKHRPAKPFAVMMRDVNAVTALCELSPVERAALTSPARPIVLLRRRAAGTLPGVADHGFTLGVMLPSTPLHHLLLAACSGPLVMTSGNVGGEPVVTDNVSARRELGGIADLWLLHDRDIAERCDDSVVQCVAGAMRPVRRARGYVPQAIAMHQASPVPVVAFGGHLKNTVCVLAGHTAQLSAHIGDLDGAAARAALNRTVYGMMRTVGARAGAVAHDLHPGYASTALAKVYAAEHGIGQTVPVQHHHAHVAASIAEQGLTGPVIGVVFDGAGLGTDDAIWGGEFLAVDGARFTRCGHLGYVPLPGGDASARRPWRSAVAHVSRLGLDSSQHDALRPADVSEQEWRAVRALVERPAQSPRTSSVGRLFDAVAALLGVCQLASYEGEGAMRLQALSGTQLARGYPTTLSGGACWTADPADMVAGVLGDMRRGRDRRAIAASFHATLRDFVVAGCERIREESDLHAVVLSGGVFMNALLAERTCSALRSRRFEVHMPRVIPCNDGGLALGQAWVAARALEEDPCA